MARLTVLLLFVFVGTSSSHGTGSSYGSGLLQDDARYRFGRVNVADGLSYNVVYAILQDRHGFLWFGTEDGLNKYDGHSFTVYQHDPSDSLTISDNWISALHEDEQGNLWVGTRHGGLNRFNRETEEFTRYPFGSCDADACSSPERLNSPLVTSLYHDAEGTLWVGTFAGLSALDTDAQRFTHYRHDPGNPRSLSNDKIWCLAGDPSGGLWVGTWNSGLDRLDPEGETFTHYRQDHVDGPHISSDRIRAILVRESGVVWIGTSGGGLNRFDPETGTFEVFSHVRGNPGTIRENKIWTLYEDSRGVMWVGTYGGGLARFDRSTRTFRHFVYDPENPNSVASNTVSAILEDASGILWLGGDRGASRFNLAQERHVHYVHEPANVNSLGNTEILSLFQSRFDEDITWIGTQEGGLSRFDARADSFKHFTADGEPGRSLAGNIVTAIGQDHDGMIWAGTRTGLSRLDPDDRSVQSYRHDPDDPISLGSDAVLSILVDHANTLWVGTDGGGLNRLHRETGTFIRYLHDPFDPTSLSDHSVQTIFEDSRDRIWVGTVDGGLNLFDRSTGSFTSYRHAPSDSSSLRHNRVVAIYEDPAGYLWLGTYGGLNRFDPETGQFERFTSTDGLPSEPYYAIAGGADGGLWLTASSRLTYFNPSTRVVRHYTDRNGLSPNHYSPNALIVKSDREIVLGGINGLSRFHPPSVDQDVRRPPLVVTTLKKMDDVVTRDVFSEESITLSHADRFFTLEFAVLDFTDPAKHQYHYQLEGYDSDWQQMTGSIGRASYANFRADREEYVFRIRAANSQGAWNSLWIRVNVVPPWWEALWFQVSAFLLLGLIGSSAVMYTFNRRVRERAETLRLLTEGRERERQYLARELHDVPLQNLYSLRHKLEIVARNPSSEENEVVLSELHSVLEKTAEDLRILCGELRPPSLGPFGLEVAIRAHIRTVHRSHPSLDVHLSLSPDGQELSDHLRHSLFRIYQSALTNVLRHADASTLWVSFRLEQDRIFLEIRDDGRGFQVPRSLLTLARSQHFGLLGISEWAEAIAAELTVESAPGNGTVVRVVAPR